MKGFALSVGLLAGTIIGAGIFSLPYVISQIGLVTGFFYLLFFALVYYLVYLMYADLTRTTSEKHRFFYLADKFLPPGFSSFASLVIIAGLVFTLTIYLILAVSFLNLIVEIPQSLAVALFWALGSIFIFVRLNWQGTLEVFGTLAIFAIILVIFFSGELSLPQTPLFRELDLAKILIPFGPLLFAYAARVAIPKMVDEHRLAESEGRGFSLKKSIFFGSFLPALVYLVFVFGVLRLTGDVSPEALGSLTFLPTPVLILLGVLGLLTLWTSYFMIGSDVRETLKYDLKTPDWLSSLVVLVLPVGLYLAGFQNFLTVLSFTGGAFLGLEGIFIITMWRRAFPQNRWRGLGSLLYVVFILALLYSIISFVF